MTQPLRLLVGPLLIGSCSAASAQAPVAGIALTSAAPTVANKAAAAKTTTPVTYRGQTFLIKRTPDAVLTGDATDRIAQLETQLSFCYKVLLTDTLNPTCPPDRQATIRQLIKYLNLARPNWDLTAYRQEFQFYLAEDKRRRRAYDY